MSDLKVMVVDDDPVSNEITHAFFESCGYDVVTRENAIGTTAAIVRERPDVVLLDLHMPGLRGDELLKAIRERNLLPDGPPPEFIFYSGESEAELSRIVEDTCALGAIQKTGDLSEFAVSFDALVRRMRRRQALSES